MSKNRIVIAKTADPYRNLAVEEALLRSRHSGMTLFLWQNAATVVIGKNQNAYAEVNLAELSRRGARLARRKTGGGAVYHHLGNLNYTFVCPDAMYDENRQFKVILNALEELGIHAELNGRNDITANDKKFSGNAFLHSDGYGLHHGTLLVDENKDDMDALLNASASKLKSKGVASVKARVVNLKEITERVDTDAVRRALVLAFCLEYGGAEAYEEEELDTKEYEKSFSSVSWLYGKNSKADAIVKERLPFGELELHMSFEGNKISACTAFCDGLDTELPCKIAEAVIGAEINLGSLASALYDLPYAEEISALILGVGGDALPLHGD